MGGVGGGGDSRLCCMFHWVREGGEEVDGAVSVGGRGANKITFYWSTSPEECLFVCMHDGGDKKLMHMHCGCRRLGWSLLPPAGHAPSICMCLSMFARACV